MSKREIILDSAIKVFAKNGYEATTTREICEQASANINLIYYYFGDKKGLYNAIVKRVFDNQSEFLKARFDTSIDPNALTEKQRINLLHSFKDAMVDFVYTNISKEEIDIFLIAIQSKEGLPFDPPAYEVGFKLFKSLLKEADDKTITYEMLFLMSQIVLPRIASAISLKYTKNKNFTKKDIAHIKEHLRVYINRMFNE
jgi:AcrR family transcriptional regulator